ncbi:HAMP domain-containing sensor histidine kinase [Candidatus Merdisoma sp. JLR.KK006]|uniref:sensor histidine kinase n=1 Tax=Candidatus Merdisoma sp. JLR.KK006 TaxID=3112626 RepID=UPI002FF0191A
MFRKVHLRLAALCAGITFFILAVMSWGYLYISEKSLKSSSFTAFQNEMEDIADTLMVSSILTWDQLSRIENQGTYSIQVLDNGTPLLFNRKPSPEQTVLFEMAWNYYQEHFQILSLEPGPFSCTEFDFSSKGLGSSDYYGCAIITERNGGSLEIMILMPLTALQQQIHTQRLLFALLTALTAAALFLFSWHFTKRLLRPLEENQQRQTQFIAAASHELRTPLAVILSCTSASRYGNEEERAHFLDSIQSEGSRMSGLIEDMLLLTHMENHTWTIEKRPTELDTLLLETFEAFEPVAAEKSIRLFIELPEHSLPPCSCDPERIRQVLSILLHNGISYTPSNGQIHLSLTFDARGYRMQVADNGIGIPDSEKAHIFDRFYRADQARSKKGHFGLGLSIASEIIKAHQGKILVGDTPGGGSTFTIVL